ncbi:MAG: SDR family NAD(P)-dependent oxidoreductase, partial [Burkholderiaceae bacterium]
MKISDNVVLITGGASGLGGATAKMVVEAGGKALIADVNAELGERFAAQLGARAKFVRCDVTGEADAK